MAQRMPVEILDPGINQTVLKPFPRALRRFAAVPVQAPNGTFLRGVAGQLTGTEVNFLGGGVDSASIDEKEEKPIGSRHNVKTASLYKRSILNPDIDREGQGRP